MSAAAAAAAASAACAALPSAASAADSVPCDDYTLTGWVVPLTAALSRRLRPCSRSAAGVAVAADTAADGGADATYQLRMDWTIGVAKSSEACAHSDAASASAAAVASAAPALSSLLSLPELQSTVRFLLACFPFGSWEAMLTGLAHWALLWPLLARANADRVPNIARVHLRARLVDAAGAVILDQSLQQSHEHVKLVGHETNPWGEVDIVLEVPPPSPPSSADAAPSAAAVACCTASCTSSSPASSAGLYCLQLSPGRRIPLHVHRVLNESEMVFSHGLRVQLEAAPAEWGQIHSWGHAPHTYVNSSSTVQRILCIDVPMFIPTDEIVVEEADVAPLRRSPFVCEAAVDRNVEQITFPGGLPNQRVTLSFDVERFERPDAVLLFAFSDAEGAAPAPAVSAASAAALAVPPNMSPPLPAPLQLLFVHHRSRGWELPGGKVDSGEDAAQAVRREVMEEAGATITAVRPIAQYACEEAGQPRHVKTVFAAVVQKIGADLSRETSAARMMIPPLWQAMFEGDALSTANQEAGATASSIAPSPPLQFSSILHDNVYPICLRLASAAVRQ